MHDLFPIHFGIGEPKAIPWTHATPLKAAADAWSHMDIRKGDVVSWPTNLGWMMGPWLVYATLLNGASMALYDGSPLGSGFAKFVQVTFLHMVHSLPFYYVRCVEVSSLMRAATSQSYRRNKIPHNLVCLYSCSIYARPMVW